MKQKIKDLLWLVGVGIPLAELRRLTQKEMDKQRAEEMLALTKRDYEKLELKDII